MLAFTARRLLTPDGIIEHAVMVVDDGRVLEIVPRAEGRLATGASHVDFGDAVIAPGYVDLHIHGSGGFDVMDDRAEALPAIERVLARHGVTSYFPTTVTAPMESTLRALERLADAIEAGGGTSQQQSTGQKTAGERIVGAGRAVPLGIHLEGPFISHARRGVHPTENLLPPRIETFERFWQASRGHIRMMTMAPELEGAVELIGAAAARGVCVSLGHSDADFAATERAIDAGARHSTHVFNAMRPLGHRDPGILGAVLTDERVSADMIADGIHLDPAIVKLVAKAKGRELVLITDATAAAGMPDGRYRLGSMEVDVKDGVCSFDGKLAGSVLTMDRAVRNLAQFAGWSVSESVSAASRNPARVAGCGGKGVLSAGADADFLVLNEEGEVLRTFIGGVEAVS
ncbi:MAG: N-acetylglucosamine-6-phosphate deacetylase [Terriglobales bacterium]|jgi:N-acetylglucosamine-6-phosphate deacetylase